MQYYQALSCFQLRLSRVIKSATATQIYQGKNIGEKLEEARGNFPLYPAICISKTLEHKKGGNSLLNSKKLNLKENRKKAIFVIGQKVVGHLLLTVLLTLIRQMH